MPLTGIIKHLLIINVVVFIAVRLLPSGWGEMLNFYSPATSDQLAYELERVKPELYQYYNENHGLFRPFQILSYMFTHADFTHILFNMLSLVFLGPMVEMVLGAKRFLALYLISGLVGLAAHVIVGYLPFLMGQTDQVPFFAVLGASGAVFGVTIAFATLFPDRELMLLFPPIPVKAWLMAVILIGIGLYQGISGTGGNVAHFAHLGGALAGFILARHWKHGGRFLR